MRAGPKRASSQIRNEMDNNALQLIAGLRMAFNEDRIPALEQLLALQSKGLLTDTERQAVGMYYPKSSCSEFQRIDNVALVPIFGPISPYRSWWDGSSIIEIANAVRVAAADRDIDAI